MTIEEAKQAIKKKRIIEEPKKYTANSNEKRFE